MACIDLIDPELREYEVHHMPQTRVVFFQNLMEKDYLVIIQMNARLHDDENELNLEGFMLNKKKKKQKKRD